MTQPTERRFVMEPRLDAEVETLNDAIDLKANLTDPRFTDERVPTDNSVTSAKIVNGTIVNADIADATIQSAKIVGVDGNTSVMQHKRNTHAGWISANPVLAVGEVGYETDTGLSKTGNGTNAWDTLSWDAIAHSKQYVKTSQAINKGQAVYVSGSDGTDMIVSKASNASEATSSKTFGLMNGNTTSGGYNTVVTEGILGGLDTSAATAGDPVWLGTSGNLIYGLASKPVAPAHLVFIGIVEAAHATTGRIYVKVQNGFELGELHDVLLTSPTDGQILKYNSATSLWVNGTAASGALPAGGATGKSLIKNSGTDYDASWSTLDVVGGGTGTTTLTSGGYLKGAGTSAITSQTGIPAGDITSGSLNYSIFPSGSVVQVVTGSSTTAFSTTSETFVNTNLSATITPKSASNKILVIVSASGAPTAGGNGMVTSVHRGGVAGTNLGNGTAGLHYWYAGAAVVTNGNVSVYDSPATTSATTYYYTIRSWNAGVGSTAIYGNSKATITLIEVTG